MRGLNRIVQKIASRFGYSKHQCFNCKKNSFLNKKSADGIVAGFCWFCKHPIWFVLFFFVVLSSCKTYNIYIVESGEKPNIKVENSRFKSGENRYTRSFLNADSLLSVSKKASKEAWDKVISKYY